MRLLPKSLLSYQSFLSQKHPQTVAMTPRTPENSGFERVEYQTSYFLTDLIGVSKPLVMRGGAAIEFLIASAFSGKKMRDLRELNT